MDQKVQLGPLTLKNPVITASGTFGYGLEFMRYGDLSAIGAICLKGISLAPRAGNPMPRIAETPCGMLNAIGLQNVGVEKFLKEKLPYIPAGATLIANLYAQTPEDFGELAGIFSTEDKIAALEVNISCPNVREGGVQFGQDPHMAAAVVGAVKKRSGTKPVIVKLSPNVTDVRVIAKAAVDAGADMLSLINTLSGMSVDIRTRRSRLANVVGGLSGPAIKPVALRMVHQVAQAVNVPIIGMGGITSAEDVLEFILVGAHAVQIGTYNFMRPDNAFRLVEEVRVLAESLGIESWDDYRGTLQV
ncbi:dihydroorotate dehydrogenase (NAD+) catalytic subunit [Desulfomicrobium norvegicum]|uniref:Dihydroorotate dehydrogenase n=1 Tax=Desulfomicrobium norvegicum (strain DSM 1741 / NCIMB 8310) TaxID=52561 RepID=A0A8G2C1N6_DESNO|nr:dihydroorotate dehydrogenase [Desulfomicrobium norvegicum]SFL52954.1 dihydroorotate dehydrogenase (NAD+) catalytic subunit [Desulfomicrobium norvegicum]